MMETGMVPVFYNPDIDVAREVAAACIAGGCRLLEFTNRGDHAWEVFTELERYCSRELPEMILGVGSVVDPGTAALYINCGANFVVGPLLNADVARACNRRKIPYSPGCGSAREIRQAEELGCEIVKVFPGKEVGGPGLREGGQGTVPVGFHHADRRSREHRGVAARPGSTPAWRASGWARTWSRRTC